MGHIARWRRTRTVVSALGAALVTGLVTVAVPAAAQRGAAAASLTATPSAAIAGEKVTFTARSESSGARKVVLQRKQGNGWVKVVARHVDQEGEVRLRLDRAPDDHDVPGRRAGGEGGWHREAGRHHARPHRDDPGPVGVPQPSRRRPQSGRRSPRPPPSPLARPGRAVQLQRQAGSGWITAAPACRAPAEPRPSRWTPAAAGTRVYRVVTAGRERRRRGRLRDAHPHGHRRPARSTGAARPARAGHDAARARDRPLGDRDDHDVGDARLDEPVATRTSPA